MLLHQMLTPPRAVNHDVPRATAQGLSTVGATRRIQLDICSAVGTSQPMEPDTVTARTLVRWLVVSTI